MTTRSHRTLVTVLLALGLFLLVSDTAFAQCAMCRRAFASPEGQQLVAAFRSGILVLLAAPIASFAAVAFLAVRRQRRRAAALSDGSSCRASVDRRIWGRPRAARPIGSSLPEQLMER